MLQRLRTWLARARPGAPLPLRGPTLRLYTKADCPLCTAMKAELARARVEPPFHLEEVDIERDAELSARYALSIPVLEFEGRPLAKGRTTAAEFERRYARLQAEIRAGSLLRRATGRESRHD